MFVHLILQVSCKENIKGIYHWRFVQSVSMLWRLYAQPWWRHQMETFSALLALCAGNSPIPVNSPHNGQWRGALVFSLICTRINDWVNNRKAGDLRRRRGHCYVKVMQSRNCHVGDSWQIHMELCAKWVSFSRQLRFDFTYLLMKSFTRFWLCWAGHTSLLYSIPTQICDT